MFEALVVTLREGVEAALVVGIIVAFLRKEGYERHLGSVWAGIGAAAAASLIGAWLLYRWAVNEEAFEGVLYMGSAIIVGSMMIWMWRHSHELSGEMKGSLSRILSGESSGKSVGLGLFLFTFLMVFREGLETVLFLSALSLTTSGIMAVLGVLIGLSAAIAFGVMFVRGSLRIDLGRFFKITGIALGIFVIQLLINGYHELSEAGWLPATPGTMAAIGPLVQNEFFFIAAVVALPLLMLLIPGKPRETAEAAPEAEPAAARLEKAQAQRQARARMAGAVLGFIILGIVGLGFVYAQPPATLSPATPVQVGADGQVRIPLSTFQGLNMQRFQTSIDGHSVRFIAIPVEEKGPIATAFDSCLICGPKGYYQEGPTVTCLHCGSAIYTPSIGQPGGCNPVPLKSTVVGSDLVLAASDLAAGSGLFHTMGAHAGHGVAE